MAPSQNTSSSSPRSIVIVGGGIVGASIAYYLSLARSAARITLLEASANPAPAASGKAGGFLALDWHGPATSSLARLSYDLHRELAAKNDGAKKWGYRQVETWQVEIETDRGTRRARPPVSWLDPNIVRSSHSMGGSGTTAQVHPARLTEFLVARAKEQGVDTRFNAQVSGLEFDANKVTGVKVVDPNSPSADPETIPATDIVLATGPWTGKLVTTLFPSKLMPPHLRGATAIDGSRAHSVVIASSNPLSADCLFTEMSYNDKAAAPELYPRPDGTAYICGASDEVPLPPTADEVTVDQNKIAALIEQAQVLSPKAPHTDAGAQVVEKQACYLPISNRTGNPVLGGKDGVYIAAGHSCWGITNSPGTGKVMAELILQGKATSADIRALAP